MFYFIIILRITQLKHNKIFIIQSIIGYCIGSLVALSLAQCNVPLYVRHFCSVQFSTSRAQPPDPLLCPNFAMLIWDPAQKGGGQTKHTKSQGIRANRPRLGFMMLLQDYRLFIGTKKRITFLVILNISR